MSHLCDSEAVYMHPNLTVGSPALQKSFQVLLQILSPMDYLHPEWVYVLSLFQAMEIFVVL